MAKLTGQGGGAGKISDGGGIDDVATGNHYHYFVSTDDWSYELPLPPAPPPPAPPPPTPVLELDADEWLVLNHSDSWVISAPTMTIAGKLELSGTMDVRLLPGYGGLNIQDPDGGYIGQLVLHSGAVFRAADILNNGLITMDANTVLVGSSVGDPSNSFVSIVNQNNGFVRTNGRIEARHIVNSSTHSDGFVIGSGADVAVLHFAGSVSGDIRNSAGASMRVAGNGVLRVEDLYNSGTLRIETGGVVVGSRSDVPTGLVNEGAGTTYISGSVETRRVINTSIAQDGVFVDYGGVLRVTGSEGIANGAGSQMHFGAGSVIILDDNDGNVNTRAVLANQGTLTADAGSYLWGVAGAGVDVNNTGAVTGVLSLSNSADIYRGGGQLNGEVHAQGGDDSLTGGVGADRFIGEAGNDVLTGGSGNDFLDGGAGVDTAVFSGLRSSYTITAGASPFSWIVSGPDGVDTLQFVDRLQFSDVTIDVPQQSPLEAIDWGTKLSSNTVFVYFVHGGETVDGNSSARSWTAEEKAAIMGACGEWAKVCNLTFVETSDPSAATFKMCLNNLSDPTELARMGPPDGAGSAGLPHGVAIFDFTKAYWSAGFDPGGTAFMTMVHEIGHGLGLAHAEDSGGSSQVMHGWSAGEPQPPGGYASFGLNQRVYTVMGGISDWRWDASLNGQTPVPIANAVSSYGHTAGPMALDIAIAQQKYGANTTYHAGSDTYVLPTTGSTYYFSIWDSGGTDTIVQTGSASAVINLNAATLRYEAGGGGAVSYVSGVSGGFTIANGVIIENATGGSGNDVIVGNAVANQLTGGAGDDALLGNDGNDVLSGGGGADTIDGGLGNDWQDGQGGDDFLVGGAGGINNLVGGAGTDLISFTGSVTNLFVDLSAGAYAYAGGGWDALTSIEGIAGGSGNDVLLGDTGANLLLGGAGNDTLQGRDGNDGLNGQAGDDWLDGGIGNDTLEGGSGINVLIGGAGTDLASYASQTANLWIDMPAGVYSAAGVWDVFFDSIDGVLGGSGNDSIFGNASDNTLNGANGDDALIGALGNDILIGGGGFDWIVGGEGNDRLIGGTNDVDVLTGGNGSDIFDLGTACGWDVAFDFNTSQDSFYLGGLSWLGFLNIDADGDGQTDDTLLGYAGGNFVALNVSGLSLAQWNALVTAGPLSGEDGADKSPADPDPQVRPVLPDDHLGDHFADGLDRDPLETFTPHHHSIRDVAPPDWAPLMA